MMKAWEISALALVFAASGASKAAALEGSPAPAESALFAPAPTMPTALGVDPSGAVLRQRFVDLDSKALADAKRFRLNLFDDLDLAAVQQRIERRGVDEFTWFGQADGQPLSSIVLSVSGHLVVGTMLLPGAGNFQLLPARGRVHLLRQIDESALGGCGLDTIEEDQLRPTLATKSAEPPIRPTFAADDGSQVDLLVVYTAEAQAASADIGLEIQNAVDLANQSYVNSGIAMSLRLVHTAVTSTGDSGNSVTDLLRLQDPDDGFKDEVPVLRDSYCADLVSLITESGTACGIAFLMEQVTPSFQSVAYSVVKRNCLTGGIVLAHEIGHNMGGRHDWDVDSIDFAPYTYNHGYVCPCDTWHDILAYGNACGGCGAILYHSNPNLTYLGNALGVPEGSFHAADLRKTFNNTKLTVANFRKSSSCRVLLLDTPSQTITDSPDGNNDGGLDVGETVTLAVNLHNAEGFPATGLSGVLTTATPGVTIFDGTASWATLAGGATSSTLAPHFNIAVASSVACNTAITFNLAVTAEEGTWIGSFQIVAGCPAWCNDVVFAGADSAVDLSTCLNTGVQISWSPATWGAAPLGYEVRRYDDAGCSTGQTVLATGLMTTSHIDDVSTNAVNYWYKVFASNDCGRTSDGGACRGPAQDAFTSLTGYAWVSPNPVLEGTQQNFNSAVSGGSPPYTYAWDFTNNGTTDATTANTTFTYPIGAFYSCRFRVTDSTGCYREMTFQVTVNPPAFNNCAQNISNSLMYDDTPRVHHGEAVWFKQNTGTNFEIYHWNGSAVEQVTFNNLIDRNASISNGRMAWEAYDSASPIPSNTSEIYTRKNGVTVQLSSNTALDQNPIMDNGQIVWERSWQADPYVPGAVVFFDGTTVTDLDLHSFAHYGTSLHNGKVSWVRVVGATQQVLYWNGQFPPVVQQITNGPYGKGSTSLYNGKIAWLQKLGTDPPWPAPPLPRQVFYWDGSTITQLTNTAGDNTNLKLTGDSLAFWMGHDGNDWEIFRWDGTTITQLTNDSTQDGYTGNYYLDADGDTAVWPHHDGNDMEIWMWDGSSIRALSNNNSTDIAPTIKNKQVTWMQPNLSPGYSFDIMYWQEARFDVENLRLTGSATNFTWNHVPCAAPPSYRVVRGNLANLSASGGQVNLGPVLCEVTATPSNAAIIAGAPPVGTCWFYLVKEAAAIDYGKSSAYLPELPTSEDCL